MASIARISLLALVVGSCHLYNDWALADTDIPYAKESSSPLHQALKGMGGLLHRQFVRSAGLGDISSEEGAQSTAHQEAPGKELDSIFLKKGDSHFTQRRLSDQSTPVEIRGMELLGPNGTSLTMPID
ncbi:MAG: hypothetical protein P1U85_22535 [Verrucomicrobiales bacterium]|nr:hypothetical protein [Verrucomicrobiales bacterium]